VLPICERPPQHRQADDVGVTSGMGQGLLSVDADKNGYMLLAGVQRSNVVQPIVIAVIGDVLAIQQPSHYFDCFGEADLPHRSWIEGQANRRVLCERVTGTEANLEAPPTEVIDTGKFLG
jgi:hypothetical protein